MTEKCSLRVGAVLFSPVLRLLPLVWVCACGGFVTPPQNVAIGVALTSPNGLPPRLVQDGHTLELTRLRLTGTALVQSTVFATLSGADIPLSSAWTPLAEGPLARGEYPGVRLELTAVALDGTYDAKPFELKAEQSKARELKLSSSWRVELGKASVLSLVADPLTWMTTHEGSKVELIDPGAEKAESQLMDRFFESLTAARDDNRDGVEDAAHP